MPVRAPDAPAVDPKQRGIGNTINQTAAVPELSSSSTLSTTSSSRPSTATSVVESSPSDQAQSFAQRVVQQQPGSALGLEHDMQNAPSQGDIGVRDIERGAPGDPIGRRKSQLNSDVQKKQNAYFENSFAATNRDPESLRTRQEQNALVMAEFRTNVIIDDEFHFMIDLTHTLAARYQRPVSHVVVAVTHSCCLMFGGSFDSAYTLTIHAVPSLTQPITNKRNAALLQKHFEEKLGVVPSRGYVRFVPTPGEEVACDGRTFGAEAADADPVRSGGEDDFIARRASKQKSKSRLRPKSFAAIKTSSAQDLKVPTPPPSARSEHMHIPPIPEIPPTPTDDKALLSPTEPMRKAAGRRKSFKFSLFGSSKPAAAPDARPNTSYS